MDFAPLTAIVSAYGPVVVTALGALAALKIAPGVARWGYNKVIGWFR